MRYMHIHAMTLDQYLTKDGIKEADFAKLVGVTQSTENRLRKGQIPNKDLMAVIFEKTGGSVRADDFFEISADILTPADPQPDIYPPKSQVAA